MKLQIRSRNYSAKPLKNLIDCDVRTVLRMGSTTPTEKIFPKGVKLGKPIREINTAEACAKSGDKIIMKGWFDYHKIKSAEWSPLYFNNAEFNWDIFPAIIKHKNSSKGNGIFYIENQEKLSEFVANHNVGNYIIEKYYNCTKEYRLHVTKDGCFYTCRKMLKNDAEVRWHRHDMNSVWILEDNDLFEKPKNWDKIVEECVKAMQAVGLDICSCDVKVQTEKNKKDDFEPYFIILETNSASSLGDITLEKYIEQLKKMV